MAKDDHWFKFFYKLFLISTQGWKDDEVGAYLKLLINQFDRGGLPDDEVELSKLITTFKKNWPLLSKKFKKCEDGKLRNDFMDGIRKERNEIIESYRRRGEKGGRPKKQNESYKEPIAFKDKSDNISSSYSSSFSKEDDGTEEETNRGFDVREMPKDMRLNLVQIANTKEYISITCKKDLTTDELNEKWEAFKIQNFNVQKWYNSEEELVTHFRYSIKNEISKNGAHQQFTAKSTGRVTKSDGANELSARFTQSVANQGYQQTDDRVEVRS